MPSKTIMVDMEAYNQLKSAKGKNESFSQAIKRLVRPPVDLKSLEKRFRLLAFSPKAVAAVERQIKLRHRPSSRSR